MKQGISYIKKNTPWCILFFCCFFSKLVSAQVEFKLNDSCLIAQQHIYNFQFNEANRILESQKKINPNNIAIDWLQENTLFYKNFISEDKKLFEASEKKWAQLISNVHKKQFNNAWYRFVLSEMHFHKALIKLRFNEYYSAAGDIKTCHQLLKENKKMFPSFLADNKTYGSLLCVFSTIPTKYQFLSKLTGFEGDMKQGLTELETYIKSDQTYKEHHWIQKEAVFSYAMIQHLLNKNSDLAWQITQENTMDYQQSVFSNYMRARIAAYAGLNETIIETIDKKPNIKHHPFPYMDYMMGLAKLRKLDLHAAIHFNTYIQQYKGQHLIKSSYRYLAWLNIISNKKNLVELHYNNCIKYGNSQSEDDKQAFKEATETTRWTAHSIKARLLFDGKYYDKALAELNLISPNEMTHLKHQIEYHYRKARIYHETKDFQKAIYEYERTIELGENQSYYFAAYSAIYLGNIYEDKNQKQMAKTYYLKAKNGFKANKEYNNSIEQKAKTGLKRLNEI
ncbi:MAG: hypothetical protein Q8K70_01610 [Bacteroidota bacterium]|nr:hypothetical protein [Bacteroidota bacterium]